MKKAFIFLMCLVLIVFSASCGEYSEDLEARITALESEVGYLKEKIDSEENLPIPSPHYDRIYKLTEQSWTDFVNYCESIDPKLFSSDYNYYDTRSIYNNGKTSFTSLYDMRFAFSGENTINIRGPEGLCTTTTYEIIDKEIIIPLKDLFLAMNEQDLIEYYPEINVVLGTFSCDMSYISLGNFTAEERQPINFYLQK